MQELPHNAGSIDDILNSVVNYVSRSEHSGSTNPLFQSLRNMSSTTIKENKKKISQVVSRHRGTLFVVQPV